MKIIIVINTLDCGGAERKVQVLANKFVDSGNQVVVVTFSNINQHYELDKRVKIIDIERRFSLDLFRVLFRLRNIIKKEQPDIIYSLVSNANILTIIACKLIRKVPPLFIEECAFVSVGKSKFLLTLYKFLYFIFYPYARKVVTESAGIAEDLQNNFSIPKQLMTTIYNPVDISNIIIASQEEVKHHFFLKRSVPVVMICASLCTQKDHITLLKAMAIVNRKQSCNLIIVGEGPCREELENLSIELNLTDKVSFTGALKNPFPFYKQSDIFVLSSNFEGFGNVIIEAMVCKTPVISTNCPSGPSEIITNYENGILVPLKSPEIMAEAIIKLLNDNNLCNKLIRNALCDVQNRFTADVISNNYLKLFSQTIQQ